MKLKLKLLKWFRMWKLWIEIVSAVQWIAKLFSFDIFHNSLINIQNAQKYPYKSIQILWYEHWTFVYDSFSKYWNYIFRYKWPKGISTFSISSSSIAIEKTFEKIEIEWLKSECENVQILWMADKECAECGNPIIRQSILVSNNGNSMTFCSITASVTVNRCFVFVSKWIFYEQLERSAVQPKKEVLTKMEIRNHFKSLSSKYILNTNMSKHQIIIGKLCIIMLLKRNETFWIENNNNNNDIERVLGSSSPGDESPWGRIIIFDIFAEISIFL